MNKRQAKIEALKLSKWALRSELDNGLGGHYDDFDDVLKVQQAIQEHIDSLSRRIDRLEGQGVRDG